LIGRCPLIIQPSLLFLLPSPASRWETMHGATTVPSSDRVVPYIRAMRPQLRAYLPLFPFFFPLLSRSAVPLSRYPREDAHAETCTARLSHAHSRARLSARRIRCYVHGGLKETERLGSGDWPPNCRALLRHYGVVSLRFFLFAPFLLRLIRSQTVNS